MEQIIPVLKPSYKQHLAYEALKDPTIKYLLFGGGAEGGKSWLGAEWLLTNCYRYPGTKWFMGRNELTRLMGSSYHTFLKVCAWHNIPQTDWNFNGHYHYIEFKNGSRIDLIDLKYLPSDPMFQRFGSFEYTGGWIEEGGEVHFMAFDVLKARVGRWKNAEYNLDPAKILITCNPEQNWLYRVFYKPYKKNQLAKGYAFIQALYKDNPYTAVQAEKRLDEITDPVLRKRLKQGLWEYNAADNSLVTYDALTDMFTNTVEDTEDRYFTGDVARYGSDKIVFGNWKGFDLHKIQIKDHRGIDQTALDVKTELRNYRIPYSHAVVDDDGVGGGVVDLNRGIKGFVGNSSPMERKKKSKSNTKENYGNLRSQCAFMVAEQINKHGIKISAEIEEKTKEMIIEDLQQMLKKVDSPIESPLRIIKKEDIKESLGRSPDLGDMIMMRMYFELGTSIEHEPMPTSTGGVKPYIPGVG